ncbi:amidoligase family protein [Nonomuraea sp. NPDC049309]|uniref:WXG100-like domain-containing protein n=1 Tax=Nonomuraea sp. NPDC049309 TaxID=3364350 RepID=UPI00371BBAE4
MAAHSGAHNIQTPGGHFAGDQVVRIDSDVQPAWESESLPDWVNHWLIPMLSAGQKWPEASEAGMSELARRYAALSDGSMSSAEPAGLAVRTIVSGWAAPATARFAGRARELYGDKGGISGVGNNAHVYAVQASNFAVQTQYSKLTINVAFWVTVTAIAITLLAAFFSAGATTPLIGPYAAAARAAISRILAKLVAAAGQKATAVQLAKVTALSGPTGKALLVRLLASPFGKELMEEVGEEFFIEFAAQYIQQQKGTRDGFDWQQLTAAGLGGGTGAAVGSMVAGPVSRVTQVLPGFAGRALTTGATNVIASPVGGFVANGVVYGQWPNPFTAESMVGAFMGGVGRTGTISPFNPDVALALADPVTTLASAYAAANRTDAAHAATWATAIGTPSAGAPTGPEPTPSHATVNVRTPDLVTVQAMAGSSSTASTAGSSSPTAGSSSGTTSRTSAAGSSTTTARMGADVPHADSSPRRHTPPPPPASGTPATPPPASGHGPTGQGSTGQGFTGQDPASPGRSPRADLHAPPQPSGPGPQHPDPGPQHPDPGPQHPDPGPQHPDPGPQHPDPGPQQPGTAPEPPPGTTPAPHTGDASPTTGTGSAATDGTPAGPLAGHTTSAEFAVTAGEPAGPPGQGQPQPPTGPHHGNPPAQSPVAAGQAASLPGGEAGGPARSHAPAVPGTTGPRHRTSMPPGEAGNTALSEGYSPIAAPHTRNPAEAAAIVHRWTPGSGSHPAADGRRAPGAQPDRGSHPGPDARPGLGERPEAEDRAGPRPHSGDPDRAGEDFSSISRRLLGGETDDDASEPRITLDPILAGIMVTPDDESAYQAFITPVLLAYGLHDVRELFPIVQEMHARGLLPSRADGPEAFHDAFRRFYQEDPVWLEGLRGQETYGLRDLDDTGIRLLGSMIRLLPPRAAWPSAPLPLETLAREVGLAGSVAHVLRLARDAQEHGANPAAATTPRELADTLIVHKTRDPYLWDGLRLTTEHGLTLVDDDAVRVLARLSELAGPEPARPIWTFHPLRRLADLAGYGYDVAALTNRVTEAVRNGFNLFDPVDREHVIDALRHPKQGAVRSPVTPAPGLHDLSPSAIQEARNAAEAEYEQARKQPRGGSRLRRFLRPGSPAWWSPDAGMDELYLESLQARVKAWQRLPEAPEVSFTHDFSAYLRAYEAAARRAESGAPVIPYMYEDATAGLGARDGGRGFGLEIEFVLPPGVSLHEVAAALHAEGLTGDPDVHEYHTSAEIGYRTGRDGGRGLWRLEKDSTVSGELVSPILYDEPETWENLRRACEIIRGYGGLATEKTGGHVHVSAGDYDHLVANFVSVADYVYHHGDTLYRLGHNPEHEDHRGLAFCLPAVPPAEGYDSIELVRQTHEHHMALNLSSVNGSRRDHIELRMWDGSLDPAIIQAQVKVSLALVEAALRTAPLGMPPNAGRQERVGSHAGLRAFGSAPDLTESGSISFRRLMDELFWRASDKEQLTALYAITRWSPVGW